MALTIYYLIEAALLFVNAIAILNEDRFLKPSYIFSFLLFSHFINWIISSGYYQVGL